MNPTYTASHRMLRWAFILGIVSLATCLIFFISVPCGALAIILALLTRKDYLVGRAKIAITAGIIGIVASLSITGYSVVVTINSYGGIDNFVEAYQDYAKNYGYDIDFGYSSASDDDVTL